MNNWDLYAPFYNASRKLERKAYEEMYKKIRKAIKDRYVLELATGTGIIAKNVAQSAKHINATDYSEKMIDIAKKEIHISNLDFSIQDARNLAYADNSYDAVIISNALHIMPDAQKALAEIDRVLKPNGILIAPTYIWKKITFKQRISSCFLKIFGFKVENNWTKDEYIKYLTDNGWTCKKAKVLNASFPLCYVECTKTYERVL
ncbi:MAG: class I SAM-dependent methyltransferase [Ruminococcus sp.]|nr:class I SAM-dependent methyltransferase [Ruminococcus sp.]